MTLGVLLVSHAPGNEQIIMIKQEKNLQVREAIFLRPHLCSCALGKRLQRLLVIRSKWDRSRHLVSLFFL